MLPESLSETPHRRYNPLTGEWVLVSPHRAKRPWLGQVEKMPPLNLPAYDPTCYLCPGNSRAAGKVNPAYTSTYVFDNDFPALLLPQSVSSLSGSWGQPDLGSQEEGLFAAQAVAGICRVVCFSPRHDLTLPELSQAQVEAVVQTWTDQTRELGSQDFIQYVQVFENKGETMGCSNPHPHSQIWATSQIPNEPAKEIAHLLEYQRQHQSCLLCDYLRLERERGERIVTSNQHFTALVPFWAVWPFEIMLVAHRHAASLTDLHEDEQASLADILRRITARYDNLFEVSFPYSMGFHQAPTDDLPHTECHLHAHYYPPLLRSATVRKFMVGYEMLGMPQRDLTPETAAARLRSLSETHYSQSTLS
ncbi:MAG: UDP-glucose--hexose-1-phosphate uridylyltransferase [Anaerolineales bacterium]|nr:UDP-glucose--hexose-1-phosphate uridylyltransferase [Anaerolineales bacterium]